MERATTVDPDKIHSKGIRSVRDRVTNIADHLPVPMDPEAFKARMVRSLMGEHGAVYPVTPEDDARIREIAAEQFASWDRIYGGDPQFNIHRAGRFAGGRIEFFIDVQKGLIRHAAVCGDFFSLLDPEALCAALEGCRYERSAVLEALRARHVDGAVYRITAEELSALIAG